MRTIFLLFLFALPAFAFDVATEPPLHQAVYSNSTAMAGQVLDGKDADIEVLNSNGWTALQYAVRFKREALVELLLARGADPNKQGTDYHHKTPMDCLSWFADQHKAKPGETESPVIRIAQMLFDAGANVNQSRPLAFAIGDRSYDLVDWLLEHGADVSANELLVRAAEQRSPLVLFKKLVAKGAKVNGSNFYGGPLARASYDVDLMKFLVSKGADLNYAHRGGLSPLQSAAEKGHLDAVQYLIEIGAEVSTHEGRAIKRATERGHTEVAEFLALHGSAVDFFSAIALGRLEQVKSAIKKDEALKNDVMPGDYKMKPVHLATLHGRIDVLECLLKHGADPNAALLHDETALHLAVTEDNEAAVRMLLLHKADPNRKLISGMYGMGARTPLHYAVGIGSFMRPEDTLKPNLKLVELLIQNGASVKAKSERSQSIAEMVERHGSEALKRLVLANP